MRKCSFRGCLVFAGLIVASAASAQLNQPQQPKSSSIESESNNSLGSSVGDNQKSFHDRSERSQEIEADWWMVRLTGVIGAIGFLQLWVFGLQAHRLRQTIEKMDEVAAGQTKDMRDSIAEAAKAAAAMNKVAGSLKINADKIIESVELNKEIAERQKLVGELQTRAYVAVNYIGIVPQNIETGYRFEPRLQIISSGITPAYKLSHRTAADILDFPLPADFVFPLDSGDENPSIGMLGPRNSFIISAAAPRLYSLDEIQEFQAGVKKRIFVWGRLTYEDAFQIPRYLNFCQSIVWMADRENTLAFNDPRHNDAN